MHRLISSIDCKHPFPAQSNLQQRNKVKVETGVSSLKNHNTLHKESRLSLNNNIEYHKRVISN